MTDTSPQKIAANRSNAQKSTGPRTAAGKSRARLNALKHGVTAQIPVLPGEDPALFFARVDDYKAGLQPRSPFENDMVERMALMSWQFDRAARVEVARLAIQVETAAVAAAQRAEQEADALGERLFFDRGGPLPNQVKRDYDYYLPWTSWSGIADDPDSPHRLVKQLECTGAGVRFLLDRWAELRTRIEAGQCWQSPEKLKAVRLLGRQPQDAADVVEVTEVYLACHALRPDHKHAFFEVRCEMTEEEFESYEKRLRARDLDAIRPKGALAARAMLLGLVDRATSRLSMLAADHRIHDEKLAVWRAQAVAFDDTKEGERLRRYAMACERSRRHTFADLLKNRKDGTTPEFDILEPVDEASSSVGTANDQDHRNGRTGDDAQQFLQNEPTLSYQRDARIESLVDGIFRDAGIGLDDDDFEELQNEPTGGDGQDLPERLTSDDVEDLQNEPTGDGVCDLQNEPTGDGVCDLQNEPTGDGICDLQNEPTGDGICDLQNEPTGDGTLDLQNEPTVVSAPRNLQTHSTAAAAGHRSDGQHAFPLPSALRPPSLTLASVLDSVLRRPSLTKAVFHASDGKYRRNRKGRNKQQART